MRIFHASRGLFRTKVQSREIAGIGIVAKADIYGVCTIIDRGFQGRQSPSGADQFGFAVVHVKSSLMSGR
ncbi:hypothetical protein GGI1_14039 [Acidithiobacillus sp. GGI-221]|nr:hypothetical protein GGI1_14039 [Acidithiobacillus sp. GGI-221]